MKYYKWLSMALAIPTLLVANYAVAGIYITSGASCVPERSNNVSASYDISTSSGFIRNKSSGYLYIYCPLDNSSVIPMGSIIKLRFDGYVSSNYRSIYCRIRTVNAEGASAGVTTGTGYAGSGGGGYVQGLTAAHSAPHDNGRVWASCAIPKGDDNTSRLHKLTLEW